MITPTGAFGQALVLVRDLISQSETWQSISDATSSEDFIYIGEVDAENLLRPHCIVCKGPGELSLESIATGANMTYTSIGDISIFIETEPTDLDASESDQYIEALNLIEGIICDMAELSGANDNIHLNTITLSEGPLKITHGKEQQWGTYFGSEIHVTFGSTGVS